MGLAWCLSRALLYVASGVERKEKAFFSPGESGLIEAIRRKWGLGVGMPRWGEAEPPHSAVPPLGGLWQGNFSLDLFIFFSLCVMAVFFQTPKRIAEGIAFQSNVNCCFHSLLPIPVSKNYFSQPLFHIPLTPLLKGELIGNTIKKSGKKK